MTPPNKRDANKAPPVEEETQATQGTPLKQDNALIENEDPIDATAAPKDSAAIYDRDAFENPEPIEDTPPREEEAPYASPIPGDVPLPLDDNPLAAEAEAGPAPEQAPKPKEPKEPSPSAKRAQRFAEQSKVAGADALHAFKNMLADPVGLLGPTYTKLGEQRALGVGAVFGVAAAFGMALAASVVIGTMIRMILGDPGTTGIHFGVLIRSFIAYVFGIAAGAGAIYALTPIFRGKTSVSASVYMSGATFLPLGLALFLAAIIAAIMNNRLGMILVTLLTIVGLCFMVMVLNAGFRHITGLNERRASLATPAVLAIAGVVIIAMNWLLR